MSNKKVNFGPIRADFDPFGPLTRERDFCRTCGFRRKLRNIMFFHFKQKKYTSMDQIFTKTAKTLFWAHFDHFLPQNGKIGFFPKNRASSLFFIYGPLTSCKKSEKTHEPILRKSITYLLTYLLTRPISQVPSTHRGGPKRSIVGLFGSELGPIQA